MTTWYGKTASKQMEQLLETRPKLHQLLLFPDFLQELKSFNSKLLEYITNTSSLIGEAIDYFTLSPSHLDSSERKFKYPLLSICMVEMQITAVLNSFFKEVEGKTDTIYFDLLFTRLDQFELLPLLAGYLFRVHSCLISNRYQQCIDRMYSRPRFFDGLIKHAQYASISNIMQLYLNLDLQKSSQSVSERLAIKMQVIRSIIRKIGYESRNESAESAAIIENLNSVIIETVDKYYLILDGKEMLQGILAQPTVDVMLCLAKTNNDAAWPAFNYFISLINYFSYASMSIEEGVSAQSIKQSIEALDSQPLITTLMGYLSEAIRKLLSTQSFSLYHYRLLEIYCHCISISSQKIMRSFANGHFFQLLGTLLFRHEQLNILHMLIKKSFTHIFTNDRPIYHEYRRHLFQEADLLEMLAGRPVLLASEQKGYAKLASKAYFGHLMAVLVMISTQRDETACNAFKIKHEFWQKTMEVLINPYKATSEKPLGSYENVPQPKEQQFTIGKTAIIPSPCKDNPAVLEVEKEENLMSLPPLHLEKKQEQLHKNCLLSGSGRKIEIDAHLEQDLLNMSKESASTSIITPEEKQLKRAESFKQFISKKKVEAEREITLIRSLSQEGKLSRGKTRMSSPSPNKRNSWVEKIELADANKAKRSEFHPPIKLPPKQDKFHKIQQIKQVPKNGQQTGQNKQFRSINMDEVQKIRVFRVEAPRQKRYRRAAEKDKLLLDFLALA